MAPCTGPTCTTATTVEPAPVSVSWRRPSPRCPCDPRHPGRQRPARPGAPRHGHRGRGPSGVRAPGAVGARGGVRPRHRDLGSGAGDGRLDRHVAGRERRGPGGARRPRRAGAGRRADGGGRGRCNAGDPAAAGRWQVSAILIDCAEPIGTAIVPVFGGVVSLVQPRLPAVLLVTGPPLLPLWWGTSHVEIAWHWVLRRQRRRSGMWSGDQPSYAYVQQFAEDGLITGQFTRVVFGEITDGRLVVSP